MKESNCSCSCWIIEIFLLCCFSLSSSKDEVGEGKVLPSSLSFSFSSSSFFFFFLLFRATPSVYGGSQARGLMRAVATGLHHSHSNEGSELHLQPTPQLTVMLDSQPPE